MLQTMGTLSLNDLYEDYKSADKIMCDAYNLLDSYRGGDRDYHAALTRISQSTSEYFKKSERAFFNAKAYNVEEVALQVRELKIVMEESLCDEPEIFLKPAEKSIRRLQYRHPRESRTWQRLETMKNDIAEMRIDQSLAQIEDRFDDDYIRVQPRMAA